MEDTQDDKSAQDETVQSIIDEFERATDSADILHGRIICNAERLKQSLIREHKLKKKIETIHEDIYKQNQRLAAKHIESEDRKTIIKILSAMIFLLFCAVFFCVYNTAHASSQAGMFTTDINDISELKTFSNSFAYSSDSVDDIRAGLDINNNAMRPNFDISLFFFNENKGIFEINANIYAIIDAINESVHDREMGLFWDEPLWKVRMACHIDQKPAACDEIKDGYQNTFSVMQYVNNRISASVPQEFFTTHIESFAELIIQKTNHPSRSILMSQHVDYIGFDCYGAIDACGIDDFHLPGFGEIGLYNQEHYYNAIEDVAIQNGQSIIIVPGTFTDGVKFPTDQDAIEQFNVYMQVLDNKHIVVGIFGFIYNDIQVGDDLWIGMKNSPALYDHISNEFILRK